MTRPTFIAINTQALQHNLARVRTLAPGRLVMAMVKANAYGHGLVRAAQALSAADALGVASLEEGMMLREAGIKQPIVLMEGVFQAEELQEAVRHRFTLVIHHEAHVRCLEEATLSSPLPVWLKINTGMNRLGIAPAEMAAYLYRLQALPAIVKPIGLMTHFAEADSLNSDATKRQLQLFKKTINGFNAPISLANSAAILAYPDSHGHWVRPGLMLYGASPFEGKSGLDHELQPVMTFSSRLIVVNNVQKGDKVGYGGTWTASEPTKVGIVGAGYGDGYPQFAQNGTPVLVNGVECKLAGRVSMDMLAVDLSNVPEADIGDPVVLWGEGLPVERVAKCSNSSAYELLTRMTARPKFI